MGKWIPVPLPPFVVPADSSTGQRFAKGLQWYGVAATLVGGGLGVFGAPGAAGAVAAGGVASTVGSLLVRPPRVRRPNDSPNYGFSASNPADPDTPLPILYGTHRVVPVILQEFISPLADVGGGVNATKKQGISLLLGVAEGEVSDMTDIRLNGQPIHTPVQTDVTVGTGNGTLKKWTLPHSWVVESTLAVTVGGTAKANVQTAVTGTLTYVASDKTLRIEQAKRARILTDTIRVYGNDQQEILRTDTLNPWTVRVVKRNKVTVKFTGGTNPGQAFRVSYSYLGHSDMIVRQDGKGRTTIEFGVAPSNGAKILATYRRANFRNLRIETRRGTVDQLPIEGFEGTRQTFSKDIPLVKDTANSYTASGKVNDLIIGLSAPSGFVRFTDDGGSVATYATVAIQYALETSAGAIDSVGWRTLYHLGNNDAAKPEFRLGGATAGSKHWEVSLRTTLQELVDAGWSDIDARVDLEDDLASLAAGVKVRTQVTRKDTVGANSSTQVLDRVNLAYYTEVNDVRLSYPGTALLALRATATENLSGTSPFVEVTATRAPLYDPRTGAWDGDSYNPALAIYDLLTSGKGTAVARYGSKGYFSASDIYVGSSGSDAGSLWAFANWCEEQVSKGGSTGATEDRHRLDIVLDTPMSLSEWVADIAAQARCIAVQQGTTWRFPLDKDGSAAFAFTEDADPANANMVGGTFSEGPEDVTQTPTDVELSYFDAEQDYQEEVLIVSRDDLAADAARNILRVDGTGISRASEAQRYARHLLETAVNHGAVCQWDAHPGALLPEAGDIVSVTSYAPGANSTYGWSAQKVRVLAMGYEPGAPSADGAPTLPPVRYFGRILKSNPYSVSATITSTVSGSLAKGPGTASVPGSSGANATPGSNAFGGESLKVNAFKVKVL